MKYIDADRLRVEIEQRLDKLNPKIGMFGDRPLRAVNPKTFPRESELEKVLGLIDSLQQEQPIEGKQIVIITETDGDANIHWDCRSLDDVKALLASAQSFITDKQVEELRGIGSGPDYNTTEGRFRNAHKFQQEQSEVDIEKEYIEFVVSDPVYSKLVNGIVGKSIARHFYKLGLNTRKSI